ncbi:MAG: phosphate acetyltransferase [Deltaproteobacteria bacterium]|nr:MAG: phosphate acetyltransferase [Deltaproteobacteria bacterium]
MSILDDCIESCRKNPGTVAFADCLDQRVLTAAARLKEEKLAVPLLVQSPFAVRNKILNSKKKLTGFTVVDHTSKDVFEENVSTYTEIQKEKEKYISREEAEKTMGCSLAASAMLVLRGAVEIGVAGNLSSTAAVLRAGISILPRKLKTISSFFLMISPDNKHQYIFSDCAVVPEPTPDILADIAIASAEKAKNLLNEEPRVALLSFSTKGSSNHSRARMISDAVEKIRNRAPDIHVDGELQLDAAIDPSVAAIKAPGSVLKGNANVLVFPSLEAGNIAYKMLQRLGGYMAIGPFLQGFQGGWHDLSRGCSSDDIFNITVMGLCMQRSKIIVSAGA